MTDATLWFTLGTAAMLLGTLVLASGLRFVPSSERLRYAILVAVPGIAVIAYGVMALGLGGIVSSTGSTVYLPRYGDWLLTTPLHVLYLGIFAGASMGVVLRAMGFQAATIILGLAGAVLASPWKWLLYLAGCVTFAVVVYYALTDFVEAADRQGGTTTALYRKLRAFLVVLWLVYPVIWVVGPAAVGLMDVETTALVVTYIDVVAKVGFGLIALNGQFVFSDVEVKSASRAD